MDYSTDPSKTLTFRVPASLWQELHLRAAAESVRLGKRVSLGDLVRRGVILLLHPLEDAPAERGEGQVTV